MPEVRQRRTPLDLLIAILLGGASFGLYVATLAPTILAGDGGEFQFVPYLLGVAHPTGYPLYILLGWLWSHLLPVGDVAYRMNLFSAFWAAWAVALLYPTTRILLRQAFTFLPPLLDRPLSILVAVTFAVTPTFWSQAVIAEVYGLHMFFIVLLFYLVLTWAEHHHQPSLLTEGAGQKPRQGPSLLVIAFTFGLSLTHHRTTLLLAPAFLIYLWLVDRSVFRRPRLLIEALLLMLLPLVLYLYIPLRAPHTPYLRLPLSGDRELVLYENTAAGLVQFVLGGPFGGSVDLSVDLGKRLLQSWGFMREEVGWIGVVLSIAGVVHLAFSRPEAGSRRRAWALLALTGLTFLATVAFNLVYTIGDIYVLYIPAYLMVVFWLAIGVGTLASLLRKQRLASLALVLLCFALPFWLAFTHFDEVDQRQNDRARTAWEALLAEPLPPGAVLVSDNRNDMMPLWYLQYIEGKRPDLLGLFPLITPEEPTLGHVLDLALSTGRPVYLIKDMPGIGVKAKVEPEGKLWRVLGPAVEQEPAYELGAQLDDAVALVGYDRSPHSPRPGEPLQVSLYWEALRPLDTVYHSFVHLVDAEGRTVAQSDQQPGGVFYPTTLWRPAERLRDDHNLTVPADTPPGVYRLLAGMYDLSDDGPLQLLGEPVVLGSVAVKTGLSIESGEFSNPVGARFGGQIELLGYDTSSNEDVLAITLHWRCLQPPDADYTVFVHLLDANGQVVAQHDGQPQGGSYPFSVCDAGEVVIDEHPLTLPPGLPPGDYRLRVGLYRLETGERLPVDGNGDSIELGPVEISETQGLLPHIL